MIEHLLDTDLEWSHTDENLAMLIDRLDFWLSTEYTGWITDPEDPEVKRARAERKRSGIKPSPVPLIPPVAKRPPQAAQAAQDRLAILKTLTTPDSPVQQPGESKIAALDRHLGGG